MTELTNDQRDRRLAELLGWTNIRLSHHWNNPCQVGIPPDAGLARKPLPFFSTSLDAVVRAVEALNRAAMAVGQNGVGGSYSVQLHILTQDNTWPSTFGATHESLATAITDALTALLESEK